MIRALGLKISTITMKANKMGKMHGVSGHASTWAPYRQSEAVQLPKPMLLGNEIDGSSDTTVTTVTMDSFPNIESTESYESPDTVSEKDVAPSYLTIEEASLRQQLHRLQDSRVLQEQSLVEYHQKAEVLNPTSRAVSSWARPQVLENKATLVVKGLPAYYTQEMLCSAMADRGFKGHLDIYVPCSLECSRNMGYAVVHFTQPKDAVACHALFHLTCLDEEMRMTGRMLVVEPLSPKGYEAKYCQPARTSLCAR